MGRDLELLKLELELDKDGSLVSIESRGWNIRVVPGRVKHWRHPFVRQRHKHDFAMRPSGPACAGNSDMTRRPSEPTPLIDLVGAPGTGPLGAQRTVYVDLLPRCNAACPCRADAHRLVGMRSRTKGS